MTDKNNLPNGMEINPFQQISSMKVSLQDINYIKIICDKLKEIKEFEVNIDTIDIKEDSIQDNTSLMLVMNIKDVILNDDT